MSFVSSVFGGGGGPPPGGWPTDYLPGESPPEQAVREARKQTQVLLDEQTTQQKQAADIAASDKAIADKKQADADQAAADEENLRQQRLRGGGIQRFMTAGYSGYGDSRSLGTATTLGG
jgi:hypothetical protein